MELRGTLQCIEWINNQDLLSSTGNYIYYIVITYDERESRIIYVCVCVYPWWLRWYRICLQCKRPEFDPWVRKISWRRKWHPTLVFLPGEFHGQRSLAGYIQSMWSQRVTHD